MALSGYEAGKADHSSGAFCVCSRRELNNLSENFRSSAEPVEHSQYHHIPFP
jgi:hypothetical protein